MLGACGVPPPASTPTTAAPAAPPSRPADDAASASPVPARAPEPQAIAPAPADPASLVGWWRGDQVCIELFANGDFEVSAMGRDPKVMAMGAAKVTANADGFELRLTTARIWKGRFTGPCRKVHELGGWVESEDVLGVEFKPGAESVLTLKRSGDAQIDLCGQRCATLTRATPHLGARWRRADLTFPDRPERPWQAGELLELALGNSAHVWTGFAGGKFGAVYGRSEVAHVSPDRFTVTFTPGRTADVPAGTTASALGLQFTIGATQTLNVRRLAGERLEVCAADRCATLERQFDAYHHDLD